MDYKYKNWYYDIGSLEKIEQNTVNKQRIAFLMAWHPRLGQNSLISSIVSKDVARYIAKKFIASSDIEFKRNLKRQSGLSRKTIKQGQIISKGIHHHIVDEKHLITNIVIVTPPLKRLWNLESRFTDLSMRNPIRYYLSLHAPVGSPPRTLRRFDKFKKSMAILSKKIAFKFDLTSEPEQKATLCNFGIKVTDKKKEIFKAHIYSPSNKIRYINERGIEIVKSHGLSRLRNFGEWCACALKLKQVFKISGQLFFKWSLRTVKFIEPPLVDEYIPPPPPLEEYAFADSSSED